MSTAHVIDSYNDLAALHYKRLAPGDVVEVRGEIDARKHNGKIGIHAPGTSAEPIVIRGSGTITGPGLHVFGRHVRIEGITFKGATWGGVKVARADSVALDVQHISVSGCAFVDCAAGVWIEDAAQIIVKECAFRDLRMNVADDKPDNDFGANAVHVTKARGIVVENCLAVNLNAPSPDYGTDGGFLELYGNVSDVLCENNVCYDVITLFESGGMSGHGQDGVTVKNNVIYLSPGVRSSSKQRYTIHTPLASGQYRLAAMSGFNLKGNTFYNFSSDYIPGKAKLTPEQLVMIGDVNQFEVLTEAEFFARHPVPDGETPQPPTTTPEPTSPNMDGVLELKVAAVMDGMMLAMTDDSLSLTIPREALTSEEAEMITLFRKMPAGQQGALQALMAAMVSATA